MPKLRILTPEEVAARQPRRGRKVDLSEYVALLAQMGPGQMGEAALEEGEKKGTIKRRITSAAKQLGKELAYRRSGEGMIVYEVTK